jgi:hypothetical protein
MKSRRQPRAVKRRIDGSAHRHRPVITPSSFAIFPVVVFSFFWSGSTTTTNTTTRGFLVGLVAIQAGFFLSSPEQWPVRPSGSQIKKEAGTKEKGRGGSYSVRSWIVIFALGGQNPIPIIKSSSSYNR